jgi:cytochrome P450
LTNLRLYEPYEDECTAIFCRSMTELQGQPLDLAEWLQWYAFDVIACITFQRRFGFMEERRDVKDMISGVGVMFPYMASVGQFPWLHPWLMGNRKLMAFYKWLAPNTPDPMKEFLRITQEEIDRYDSALDEKRSDRTDMLAQLRDKEAKTGKIPPRDVVQHLSSNLIAGSDTTGISLRACFYFLMRNPGAYRNLMAEIDQADRDGLLSEYVTYEESMRLPYL